jgi:Transposase
MYRKYITKNGQKYAYLVESYRENGKVKQRTIEYLGKVEYKDGKEIIVEPKKRLRGKVKVKHARRFGDVAVLYSIAQELCLQELICKQIVKNGIDPGDLSTIIAINKVVDPVSGNKLGAWYEDTALRSMIGLDENKISSENIGNMFDAMLTRTEAGGIEDKIFQFEIELWEKLKTMFDISKSSIVYDLTSTYVYGKSISIVARGHNRDENSLQQYNIGLAVTQSQGIPIHFKVYPGNIVDVSTVKNFVNELKAFGISDVTFVMDRGFYSSSNLVDLRSNHSHVIGAIPASLKLYSALLTRSKNIEHPKNARMRGSDLIYLMEYQDSIEDTSVKFVVVLDPKRREAERTKKMRNVLEIEEQLNRIKARWQEGKFRGNLRETIASLIKGYSRCFRITIKKYDLQVKRRDKAIQRILNRCGKYILFTTHVDMDPLIIINRYVEKDVVEKSFFVMKHLESLQPTRYQLENRVYANVFMSYLGLLLYTVLKSKLKEFTSEAALEELARIREIEFTDESGMDNQLTELTRKQKAIIKILDMKSLFGLSYCSG